MRRTLICLLALALVTLPGCFRNEYVIKLRPDGSGTLVVTSAMSKAQLEMMKDMAKAFGGEEAESVDSNPFSRANLEKESASMGEGVKLVSTDAIDEAGFAGARAVYSFDDVTKLRLRGAPSAGGTGAVKSEGSSPFDDMKIEFRPAGGGPAQLTLTFPEKSGKEADQPGPGAPQMDAAGEAQLAMAKQFLTGLRMSLTVVPEGTLGRVEGATARGGSVPVFEMDFDKVLAKPDAFKGLMKLQESSSFGEVSEKVNGIDGLTVPTAQSVRISFEK